MQYTNAALTVIALLLGVIAWQQYDQRPVTIGELRNLVQGDDPDKWESRRDQIPVTTQGR
jgi:hypothetical protein